MKMKTIKSQNSINKKNWCFVCVFFFLLFFLIRLTLLGSLYTFSISPVFFFLSLFILIVFYIGFEPQWKPIYIFTTLNLCFIVKHNNKAHILTHTRSQKVFKEKGCLCVKRAIHAQWASKSHMCVCLSGSVCVYVNRMSLYKHMQHKHDSSTYKCTRKHTMFCVSGCLNKNFSAFHTCERRRTTHTHTLTPSQPVSIHFFLILLPFRSCLGVVVCFVWMAMCAWPSKMSVPLKQPRAICMYGTFVHLCGFNIFNRIGLVFMCAFVSLALCMFSSAHTHTLFSSVEHRHADAPNE